MPSIKLRAGAGVMGRLGSMRTTSLRILPAQPAMLSQWHGVQTCPPLWLKMEKSLLLCNCVFSHFYFCHWLTGWEERRGSMGGRHQGEGNYHQIRKMKWEGRKRREKEKTDVNSWSCPLQTEFRLLYRCLGLVSLCQDHKARSRAGFSSKEGSSLAWFSNIKQRASENTTRPRWLVRGLCPAGWFILNSWGYQPDGYLLPCLPKGCSHRLQTEFRLWMRN